MEISQSVYGTVFIYSVVIGIILGVIYDIFRVQRISMESNNRYLNLIRNIIIFAEDIIFSVISAVLIIVMIFHANNGRIRWFALIGSGIGFIFYYNTIGQIVMLCSWKIIAFIRYCIRTIKRFIRIVFIRPLLKFFNFVAGLIYKRYIIIKRKLYTEKYIKRELKQRWNRC
jgi:Spore cortex protein YabQ (Spore_YabQ).